MFLKKGGVLVFLRDEFLYSGHLGSLGAAGIVYISSVFFISSKLRFVSLLIPYLVFQSIFLYDRYRGIEKDKSTNTVRTRHLLKYSSRIPLILYLQVFSVIIISLIFANTPSLLFSVSMLLLGIAYPIYFKDLTRRIYLFKNFYVSAVYALLVFSPILFYSVRNANLELLIIFFIFIFSESMINQVALDVKDTKSDKVQRYYTLPVLFGKERALIYLKRYAIFSGLVFLPFVFFYNFPALFAILVIVSLLMNLSIVTMIYKDNRSGYALSAGKFFVWFLIALLLTSLL